MKRVLIATGGTGGHIYPALALAEILKETISDVEIAFFGSSNRMEASLIPEKGYPFYGMEMQGMNGGIVAKVQSAVSLVKAYRKCLKILKEFRPDACVAFGNYISVPLILAAHHLHIPTMLHEQNSFAGKANRFLAKYADAIVGSYESNRSQFPSNKFRLYGNPEASIVAKRHFNTRKCEEYGIDPNKPFVFFMMGSLGSSSVSKVIDESCPLFRPDYQVLIATGKSNEYQFQTKSNNHIRIVEYVDGAAMLNECALAITRAGATTVSEICALGTCAILIPSPYVPNNHQFYNSKELVDHHAAILLEEKDLNKESLVSIVNELMSDSTKRNEMKQNAYALGKTNAAYEMIKWLQELCHEG